jgi:hypothetical protein
MGRSGLGIALVFATAVFVARVASAQDTPHQSDPPKPIDLVKHGYGFTYVFDRCEDTQLGLLARRANREKVDLGAFSEIDKTAFHQWADAYDVRIGAQAEDFKARNGGKFPDYVQDISATCAEITAKPEYVNTRERLEQYGRREISAEAALSPKSRGESK